MKKKVEQKLRAILLRKKGYSVNEIFSELGVAKSSVSVWVRNVPLNSRAKVRLLTKIKLGQVAAAESHRRKTENKIYVFSHQAEIYFKNLNLGKKEGKLICALLYWCEGAKSSNNGLSFTNSDPNLIKTFLYFLRKSFSLKERKFRGLIHLHAYHNEKKQVIFWSKVTNIPVSQFSKSYLKSNTGKRIKENYQGCINIRYHDNDIARELNTLGKVFVLKFGLIG